MAGTSGSEVRWAWVAESTAGTTPASPSWSVSPFENINISGAPNIREQRNIAANRRRSDVIRSGYNVNGQARGGFIYGVYDDLIASLLQSSWSSDVLKDSVSGENTFTFEQTVPMGAGGTNRYFRYRGIEFTAAEITLEAEQDARIQFDIVGRGVDAADSGVISPSTYTDPTNETALGSGADVGSITIGGLTVPCIRSLNMRFELADKDRQPRIASDDLCGMRRGAVLPVLTGEFYIETGSDVIYDAVRTGTEVAVTVPIGSTSGEKYTFQFPACEFTSANMEMNGADLFQPFTLMAKWDSVEDAAVKITRAIS